MLKYFSPGHHEGTAHTQAVLCIVIGWARSLISKVSECHHIHHTSSGAAKFRSLAELAQRLQRQRILKSYRSLNLIFMFALSNLSTMRSSTRF